MNAAEEFLPINRLSGTIALQDAETPVTYGELVHRSMAAAEAARRIGVRPGDRVLLIALNSTFWVAAYAGLMRYGAVVIPISLELAQENLMDIAVSTSAVAAFVKGRTALNLASLALPDKITRLTDEDLDAAQGRGEGPIFDAGEGRVPAAIMYTSGSCGRPRGVIVSHRNISANTASIIEYLELTERDRIMVVLPFYYCFGTSLLHTHLKVGGSLVLNNQFLTPDRVLRQMKETFCTGFAGVPSTYQILLKRSSLTKMSFPHLNKLQQAGGRLPQEDIDALRAALPQARLFVMYGQTEATARLSYLPSECLVDKTKKGSIGRGIPGVTLRVEDQKGNLLSPGERGEIVAEGNNITMGYWNDPEETAKTFRNGRLYTGDLGKMDEDGFITIVDRAKNFLKCGGHRVGAEEIEATIRRFPGVEETAVVAVPDALLGEAVKVFLVCASAGDGFLRKFRRFCSRNLSSHLQPKEVVLLDRLPRNSSGKIDRYRLKQWRSGTSRE